MIDPYKFIECLTQKLPEDAIVVCANGTACVSYFNAGVVKKGQRVFWNSGCAAMGYSLPASIGAAFANPGKEIICLEGDGSLMMSIQSLETIKHYNLPIKIILYSNNGYHSLQETYDNFCNGQHYGSDIGDLSFPDWYKVAHSYGIIYTMIKEKERDLERVIDLVIDDDKNRPIFCEVILGDYKFRKQEL